jgi:glycosyltransferase involved in cell wall biosynthesis
MNLPLLSIIIPTKDRYEYLKEVISILSKIISDQLEIIIQDNSTFDNLRSEFLNYLENLHDFRVKYFYNKDPLSVVENCDKAVVNALGKYLCMIGDDDCVTAQILDAAKWMERNSVDVLTFNCPSYIWTDVEFKYLSEKYTGSLTLKLPSGKVSVMSPSHELENLLHHGGQIIKNLPQFYHSIASRKALDRIYQKTGTYFPGSSPDMAIAVSLAFYTDNHFKIDVPIIIAGTAKKSAGGMGAAKMHKGDINKIAALPKDTAKTWNPYIPFFWSGPTIYADSVYKSLVNTGNESMMERFNYNYLYATLFIFNSDYNVETRKAMSINKKTSKFKIFYFAFLLFFVRSGYFIKNRLPAIFKAKNHKISCATISDAVNYLEEIIDKMSLPWQNNL